MNYVNGQNVSDTIEKKSAGLQKSAKNVASKVEDAESGVQATISDVQEMIQARYSQLSDMSTEYRDAAESFVRKNPFYAIAGAAAVGLLFGAALSSMRSSRR